jgi:hypothetical protein
LFEQAQDEQNDPTVIHRHAKRIAARRIEMKTIDGKDWTPEVQRALANASAGAGAKIVLKNGKQIVVIDADLWDLAEKHLPSLGKVLQDLREK